MFQHNINLWLGAEGPLCLRINKVDLTVDASQNSIG